MAGIRTMISIVNGASRQIRRIGSDISGLIENAKRLNGTELIRTNVIDRAKNGVERVRATVDKLKTDIVEAAKKQKEHDDAVKGTNRNANMLVNTMRRLLGIYIGLAGLKKILSISDDVSQTSSRIKLINDGLQTTAELEDKIMKSANRSRAAYSDTAKVISKLGITAKKSFKNNDEMIAFTELVTKSFKVGGASASEQTNGMYQLTQAMASGRLQGDEFRSIIENAPLLAKAIADYTGVGQKGLKKMASDGAISADIIKEAVFNSANEIEQKYKQLPITFADIWNRIKNASIIAFRPFLLKISEIANNEKFSKALNGIVNLLALLGTVLANVINIAVSGASFIYENWSIIEPIFWAIIGVIALYTVVTTTQSIATTALAIAQWALNSAILACPLFWIIAAILAVIIVIGILIHRTIGFKAAWMIAANVVITIWDSLVIAGHMMANGVCDAWDKMLMGAAIMSTGIRNALTNMKAWGLSIIDAFINKAIDAINTLINAVNKIPGVALPTIQHVNIAANAKIEAHAKTSLRDAILNDFINEKKWRYSKKS
nr:MAG TPA: Tail tape measure [Caudoviricetes sp.]